MDRRAGIVNRGHHESWQEKRSNGVAAEDFFPISRLTLKDATGGSLGIVSKLLKDYQEGVTMPRRNRQEQALIALLEQPTIREAAEVSGISQPTLFRYLQDASFREEYHKAKRLLLEAALGDLQKASSEAVATLREVLANTEAGASSRVQAARAILGFAIQTGQLEDIVRRLDALESRLKA